MTKNQREIVPYRNHPTPWLFPANSTSLFQKSCRILPYVQFSRDQYSYIPHNLFGEMLLRLHEKNLPEIPRVNLLKVKKYHIDMMQWIKIPAFMYKDIIHMQRCCNFNFPPFQILWLCLL